MKTTIQELKDRIAELERKVKELEARPAQQFHYHYQQPYYVPQPTFAPTVPQWPTIWCTSAGVYGTTGVAYGNILNG